MLAVLFALLAALLYAVASVLQQRAAATEPPEASLRLGLLARLLRRPVWVLGVAADVAGFGCQFTALATGTLVIVQPLLVVGLLFALPIGARLSGARVHGRDLAAAAVLCAGLALFLAVSDPVAGHDSTTPEGWLALLAAGCGAAAILAAVGRRRAGRSRAVMLSAGAGVIYGVAAALTKTTGDLLARSVLLAFGHWEPYALAAVGIVGMVLAQSAFQAGSLELSLPAMSVLDPVVSVVVGALAFGESMAASPAAVAAEVVGLVATAAGVVVLSRSPAVRALREQRDT